MKPKLAAFPKCYMDELCVHRTMTLSDWIEMGATLGVQGLEFYSGFLEDNESFLRETKSLLEKHRLQMPMLCCSPDFTEPAPDLLAEQIAREKRMIEITAFFGGRFCRVLSGQRRPGLSIEAGIAQVVRVIKSLLPFAEKHGVVCRWKIITRIVIGVTRSSPRKWIFSPRSSGGSIPPGS